MHNRYIQNPAIQHSYMRPAPTNMCDVGADRRYRSGRWRLLDMSAPSDISGPSGRAPAGVPARTGAIPGFETTHTGILARDIPEFWGHTRILAGAMPEFGPTHIGI